MSDSLESEEKLDDYEVICVIGTGSFGTCYKVRNKRSNEIYVWKAIDYSKMTEDKKQLLVSEVQLLSELRHPNIVHYYNRILHKETTTLYIIMECCQGGDLAAVIASCKRIGHWVEEEFVWRVLYQTGRALQACHSHLGDVTVLHRDIKPANVFLDADNNVKLGDFGLARILKGEEKHSETMVGTPYYMSPEMIKGKKYNRKSDIWALGCLIYELCALTPPFTGANINVLAKNIKAGRFCPIPAHYSQDLYKIIVFMLSVEHEFRPTIEIILHHPTVVSHISLKKTFHDNVNKSDREKIENKKKANIHINDVTEAMKKMHLLEREPEAVSENTFKNKWLHRLEMLRNREAILRRKEEDLIEKERTLMRKERHLAVIDKVTRERLSRADVYLKQCRQSRSNASLAPRRMSIIEELDSTLSADPGDTSIIATTAKLDPSILHRPNCNLVRYGSERRAKHVHFDKQTTTTRPPSRQTVLGPIQMDRPLGRTISKPMCDDESSNLQNGILDLAPTWSEEKKLWLERKRRAYRTQGDKENVASTNVIATNDAKKIALKSNSILQFGKSHKSMR